MNVIFTILVVLVVIASILLQNGKGDSMASNFVAGNQTFGVRQTANMLEKVTWGLVAFIVIVSVISSFTMGTQGTQVDITNKLGNETTEQPAFPTPAPAQQSAPATEAPAAPAE